MQDRQKKSRLAVRHRNAGRAAICCLTAIAAASFGAEEPDLAKAFTSDSIVIETEAACYRFDVYLALTARQHRRGLMFVRELPKFTGMLFVYPYAAPRAMWMKNTFIPLDILFIRGDGTITNIAGNTEPLSLTSIPSAGPVTYSLELNAGISDELGIGTDSRVLVERFSNRD